MIEVKSVTMHYDKIVALKNVYFKAQEGKILGLLGPNGAGKTTLMRILTTYLYPTKGTVLVNGFDVTREALSVRALIGYMPETVPLYDDMMVDEYLKFIGKARGLFSEKLSERLCWVRESCDIGSIWKHYIAEISRGYRQRVGLAQALIHDPKVLILDEPTAGLDPLQIIAVRDLIRTLAKDKTIIFSTHILQEVEALADKIVILNDGRLIADGASEDIVEMASSGEKLTLVVGASRKEIEDVLKNEEMIEEFRFGGSESDKYVKFFVESSIGKPIIARLNEIIAQKGWQVREFRHEQANLEEAFIWLLSRDLKKKCVKKGVA